MGRYTQYILPCTAAYKQYMLPHWCLQTQLGGTAAAVKGAGASAPPTSQAGEGGPTCPVLGSPGGVRHTRQLVSVSPYPSRTAC